MRIFTATLGTESNTFAPMATCLDDYREMVLLRPGEHPGDAPLMCTATLWAARRRAARDGFTLIEGSCFAASPGGRTNRQDYEFMRDTILDELRAAMPLDAVLFGLHGAMVAFGYDDVEGDLLERARAITGPDCVFAVELDPHCHLTRKRVALSDIIVLYKEYPHTDTVERADDLIDILLATLRGQVRPVMAVYDCRQIGNYPTTHPEMRKLVDWAASLQVPPILSVSIGHCYPYADVPEMGGRILVVADGDQGAANRVAAQVGAAFIALRGRTTHRFLAVDAAIDAALALPGGPVVITDAADNAGGGAPSDNTTILRRLLDRRIGAVALGPLWDPMAVRNCFAAGLGASVALRFGGKTGVTSGAPIDAAVEVVGLARNASQSYGPSQSFLGDMAAVRVDGVEIVLNTARTQAFGPELFTNVGIDPASKKLLVLKSSNHFMAGYGAFIAGVIQAHSDGLLRRDDFRLVPYRRVERPIWPLDEDPQPGLISIERASG
jgi:microcystin degradation protein MlrC